MQHYVITCNEGFPQQINSSTDTAFENIGEHKTKRYPS